MKKAEIIEALYKSPVIDDIIWNITGGNSLAEDLKSELFLILLEMPEIKIVNAYEGKWLNYLCINIIKKQWSSGTSPFYKKYKKGVGDELSFEIVDDSIPFDIETFDKVMMAIEQLPLVEKELLKMRWKIGKYDKWFGELRDKDCQKDITSYRKIEKRLTIQTINSKKNITIDHSTVAKYHEKAIERIKKIIDK